MSTNLQHAVGPTAEQFAALKNEVKELQATIEEYRDLIFKLADAMDAMPGFVGQINTAQSKEPRSRYLAHLHEVRQKTYRPPTPKT